MARVKKTVKKKSKELDLKSEPKKKAKPEVAKEKTKVEEKVESKKVVKEEPFVEPEKEPIVPLVVAPVEVEKPKKKEIPVAIPSATILQEKTVIALKTTVKFVAGWQHLVKGKPFTGPAEIVKALQDGGFLEKDK
jgi:hypothetical protein